MSVFQAISVECVYHSLTSCQYLHTDALIKLATSIFIYHFIPITIVQ